MNYLNIFDDAKLWIKYIHILNKKYYRNDFLEIGAGIGSFTDGYKKKIKNIYLTEVSDENINILKKKYQSDKNINVFGADLDKINSTFNTIAHFNVLEHVEDDVGEIKKCLEKINKNGFLIILVPAHNKLYSNLDKAVGHYKRYEKNFFNNLKIENAELIKISYVDCVGYFLYLFNKLIFNKETYPSKFKIFIWDKIFTPLTIIIDFVTRYRFGKNLLCIYKKR